MLKFIPLFWLFFMGCARAQILVAPEAPGLPTVPPVGPLLPIQIAEPSKEILPGETLEYQVHWWGVPVGTATLTSILPKEKGIITSSGRRLIQLSLKARSNRYLELFYPVRVELVSLIDPESVSPREFRAYVRRRFRLHESQVTFDPKSGTAVHRLPKNRTATVSISPTTQDGLSMLYYARTLPLKLGETLSLEVTADGKNWPLTAQIRRTGTVRIRPSGTFPAVEGKVHLTYPVPFFQGAEALLWLSADYQRIPLLARIHSRIGPVTVVLTKRQAQAKLVSNNKNFVTRLVFLCRFR